MSGRSLAIVIPYYKEQVTPDEQISLHHLLYFFSNHDLYMVAPRGLNANLSSFRTKFFDPNYFLNTSTYSRLLLTPEFYRSFDTYEFMLIYQLDCLVFSDQISLWLDSSYDYIGAPWFNDPQYAERGFARVGNGGLSLRRVNSFLRVLNSLRYTAQRLPLWSDLFKPVYDFDDPMPPLRLALHRIRRYFRVLYQVRRGVQWYAANYSLNEDRFWSDRAMFFDPDFKIAPIADGLRFAFERFPRYCYEQNGWRLPFGCHAWAKWDRSFWEPYLLH